MNVNIERKFFAGLMLVLMIVMTLAMNLTSVAHAQEQARDFFELHVPCRVGADVTVVMPDGNVIALGKVLRVPAKTNWPAYTASKWCEPSTVCATAVNAVHMLVNVEAGEASKGEPRGRIISLVPAVTVAPAAADGAFFALDMPAGERVFGGFAPLVGSSIKIMTGENTGDNASSERALDGVPREGEILVIRSKLPHRPDTWMCDIENRPGGRVIAWDQSGPKVIARVVRPVLGVGRFGGTQFQETGRIRASHAGVIDVATAPRGEVGGIQIMPLVHALKSKEMASAWQLTQWMIVSPLPGHELAGTPPLFKNAFVPGTQLDDRELLPDIWSAYGRKSLVLCRINGGPWTHLPHAAGKIDDALRDVTHLRLYFPFWDEPQA